MVVLEDFVKGCLRINVKERRATIFVKVVSLILGVTALGFLFVVERMGGILAVSSVDIYSLRMP